ncbi:hypothetical protein [Sorangium sp. So ce128]|uniref:hypothetical protein n=1 Tax=Sorangium sp. So ce128 TaxID=3133281 RepID=UPI003F5E8966
MEKKPNVFTSDANVDFSPLSIRIPLPDLSYNDAKQVNGGVKCTALNTRILANKITLTASVSGNIANDFQVLFAGKEFDEFKPSITLPYPDLTRDGGEQPLSFYININGIPGASGTPKDGQYTIHVQATPFDVVTTVTNQGGGKDTPPGLIRR